MTDQLSFLNDGYRQYNLENDTKNTKPLNNSTKGWLGKKRVLTQKEDSTKN